MNTYRYKGRNRRGELLEGVIESPNPQAVAKWMMDTSIFPVSIQLEKPPKENPPWLARLLGEDKVHPMDVELFTRQMGAMSRSGLPMLQAIQGLQKSTASKGLSKVLRALVEDLDKGSSLSRGLARHPKVFGEYYVNMIRVGEDSGRLDEVWVSLLRQLEFDRQMRQRIKSAMRYPSFVLAAIFVAIAILTIFVIPVFANVYKSMKVELPLITRMLIAASEFATAYWWIVGGLMAAIVLGLRQWLQSPEGRYSWDKFKLRLPIFGPIINKGAIGRFCESFATAYRSGVPIVHAFDLVSRIVDNAFFEERIRQMRHGLERGESLSRVARGAGIFSQTELQMITVGEETGDIEGMVAQIARMYQEEVEYEVSRLGESIEPILLGFMGVLVGLLLLGIFMPLWDLGQLVGPPKS